MCGARNLGEALRRIAEGAAMIRTKGEAGSGNIVEAVRHIRTIMKEMRHLTILGKEELVHEAKNLGAPLDLWNGSPTNGKLPVPNFSAGGIATPGRRGAGDAVRRRSRFRRLRHLQERRSRGARQGHREGRHATSTIPQKLLEASEELGVPMRALTSPSSPKAN